MKKFKLWLFLALFTSNLVLYSATLSDYKGYLAAPSIFLLMSLSSNDGADFKDSVIIEYLLKEKFSVPYSDLIDKNLKVKKDLLQKYLVSEVPVASDLVGSSMADEAGLDLLSYIKTKTGLSEEAIRQRLLNNLPILETLLLILGQSYADTVSSSLFDKQNTLNGLGTTKKLLELLQTQGYGIDQLKKIISSSNSILPIKRSSVPANITYDYTIQHQPVEKLPLAEPVSYNENGGTDSLFLSQEDYDRFMKVIKKT